MSDKFSGLSALLRGHSRADDAQQPTDKVGAVCFIFVCLNAFFFGYINQPAYDHIPITWEDGAVENLTFVAFLLAGITLSVAALATRRLSLRCVYILGGITLLFFAGEEINWGQRIIGFKTPDFLTDLNAEFNIHNIKDNGHGFYFLTKEEVIFGLCLAACAVFFARKNRVLGIPFLPITLTLAILITLSHFYRNYGFTINFESLALSGHRGLFLLLLMVALLSRSARTFIAIAASFSVSLYADYTFHHSWSYHIYYRTAHDEQSEYLFSVCCLFYAMTALLDQRTARQKIAASVAALKSATALPSIRIKSPPPPPPPPPPSQNIHTLQGSKRRVTPWTVICALIIAGSGGLALMTHLHYRGDVATFQETLLLTRTAGAAARSNFDVYIDGRDLHYFKQPCDRRLDLRSTFFLSVFPQNVYDLTVEQRQHGFENLDFRFGRYGGMLDGACAAKVRLPDYEIDRISTGQYTSDDGVVTNLWKAKFPVNEYRTDAEAFQETLLLTRTFEPAARSNFDVYIDGRDLHYFKQRCGYADVKATFFLGVFPQNVDNLPVGRRQNGFENLDFDFGQYGQMIDDACAAKVRLPDYEIDRISTGQYTSDADGAPTNIWIAEFPVNK